MKNLISIFTLATLFILSSCTKEELIIEDSIHESEVEMLTRDLDKVSSISEVSAGVRTNETTIEVNKEASSVISGTLKVDFSKVGGFAQKNVVGTQVLEFEDTNGNVTNITFTVSNFAYSRGKLKVEFAIGGNDLTGLTLKGTQFIIIDDEIIG